MINLYIAPCNSGKTNTLNEIYKKNKDINLCLFFPSGSEIQSILKGNDNKANGSNYENNISVLLNKYIEKSFDPKETEHFFSLKQKRKETQDEVLQAWKELQCKQNNPLANFIKDYDFGDQTELPKVTLNPKDRHSTGDIWFNHIKLCFDLLDNLHEECSKFKILIDEPESYMHPNWINEIAVKIAEMNNRQSSPTFYIASHSPNFIATLLNETQNVIFHYKKDKVEQDWHVHNWTPTWCSSNKILYSVYDVCTIEFLDELIGELIDKANLYFTNGTDDHLAGNTRIKRFPTGKGYDYDGYRHDTYIAFIRNYYHHPDNREQYNNVLTNNQTNASHILKQAIKNAIELLGDNYEDIFN